MLQVSFRHFVACLSLLLLGCKPVEEAPEDLSALIDAFWFGFHEDDSSELSGLFSTMDDLVDVDALLDGAIDGGQNMFTEAHQGVVEMRAAATDDGSWVRPDPSASRPLFMLNRYRCDIEQLERILLAADQNALYDTYDAYTRDYNGVPADYLEGTLDEMSWSGVIEAKIPLAGPYTYVFGTGVRRVALESSHPSGSPYAVMARTWIPEPVVWENDNRSYPQDYQIEVYVPYDGDIIHLHAIWREMDLGSVGDMSSDFVARTTLTTLRQWDDTTESLCEEGAP